MWDGGVELIGSGGACGAGLTDIESIHRLSNPILDGKIQMLNKNDDDDDTLVFMYNQLTAHNSCILLH